MMYSETLLGALLLSTFVPAVLSQSPIWGNESQPSLGVLSKANILIQAGARAGLDQICLIKNLK